MTEPRKPAVPKGTKLMHEMRTAQRITVTQEAYCRCRAMGMNYEEAVMAIGNVITIPTAREWERKNDLVRARIEELAALCTQNAILKTGLDREWVIKRLMSVVDRCMQAEPVIDKTGGTTGEYRFDASGANQALRMLGDTLGMFKPAERKPEDEYAQLTDADIARIAGELAAQTGLLEAPQGTQETAGA